MHVRRGPEPDRHAGRPDRRRSAHADGEPAGHAADVHDGPEQRRLDAADDADVVVARPDGDVDDTAPGEADLVLARALREPELEGRRHEPDVRPELALP